MLAPENSILKLMASGHISINPMNHLPNSENCYPLHLDNKLYAYKKDLALPWIPYDPSRTPSIFDWYKNKRDIFRDAFKRMVTYCDINSDISGLTPEEIEIPRKGLMLRPDVVYFGKTYEKLGFSNVSATIMSAVSANVLYGIHVRQDKIDVGFGWDYRLDCPTNSNDSKVTVCFQVSRQSHIDPGMNICVFKTVKETPKTENSNYEDQKRKIYKLDGQNTR